LLQVRDALEQGLIDVPLLVAGQGDERRPYRFFPQGRDATWLSQVRSGARIGAAIVWPAVGEAEDDEPNRKAR
jgi:hypothetical protein